MTTQALKEETGMYGGLVERLVKGEGPPFYKDFLRLTAWLENNWRLREEAATAIAYLDAEVKERDSTEKKECGRMKT